MAVWLIVYGKNGLGQFANEVVDQYRDILRSIAVDEKKILDSIIDISGTKFSAKEYYENNRQSLDAYYSGMTTKEYEDYLQSIGMPYLTIDELIASFINQAEEKLTDDSKRFNKAYDEFNCMGTKSEWKIDRQTNRAVTFVNNLNYFEKSGLSISLYNDVISLVGPFEIFSNYYTFQKQISNQSREYYHHYFKSVLAAFKSDFMLYAHEWSGMIDDEDDILSSSKILETVNSRISENSSLHEMNSFYFDVLDPRDRFLM